MEPNVVGCGRLPTNSRRWDPPVGLVVSRLRLVHMLRLGWEEVLLDVPRNALEVVHWSLLKE